MEMDNVALRDLARLVLQHQASQGKGYDKEVEPDGTVLEKLRIYLSKLVGVAGFHALLARSLSQAKMQDSSLSVLRVREDGALEGFDEINSREIAPALEILLAELLGLLITFIGEQLTVQLMRDIWPEMPFDNINLRKRSAS